MTCNVPVKGAQIAIAADIWSFAGLASAALLGSEVDALMVLVPAAKLSVPNVTCAVALVASEPVQLKGVCATLLMLQLISTLVRVADPKLRMVTCTGAVPGIIGETGLSIDITPASFGSGTTVKPIFCHDVLVVAAVAVGEAVLYAFL